MCIICILIGEENMTKTVQYTAIIALPWRERLVILFRVKYMLELGKVPEKCLYGGDAIQIFR